MQAVKCKVQYFLRDSGFKALRFGVQGVVLVGIGHRVRRQREKRLRLRERLRVLLGGD